MSMMAIISKLYCSSSQTVLGVRKRPHVVNGGGFVVTDCSGQRVVFRVDGCGIHGTKGQLILRDGEGDALLLMRRKVYIYNICVWKCYASCPHHYKVFLYYACIVCMSMHIK